MKKTHPYAKDAHFLSMDHESLKKSLILSEQPEFILAPKIDKKRVDLNRHKTFQIARGKPIYIAKLPNGLHH